MKMKKISIYILIAAFVLAMTALAFATPESGEHATEADVAEQAVQMPENDTMAAEEAAEAGEHGEEGEHGSKLKGFIYQVINFAILVGLLWFAARKPIRDMLKARTETIQQKIEEARAAREKAEKALAEVNQRLQNKDREIEELVTASVKAGEKERERLIAEGERMAQNLIEQAKKNIELELDQARATIKAEAVELAMELAEKSIKEKLSESEQKRLFEEALGKLEGKV